MLCFKLIVVYILAQLMPCAVPTFLELSMSYPNTVSHGVRVQL